MKDVDDLFGDAWLVLLCSPAMAFLFFLFSFFAASSRQIMGDSALRRMFSNLTGRNRGAMCLVFLQVGREGMSFVAGRGEVTPSGPSDRSPSVRRIVPPSVRILRACVRVRGEEYAGRIRTSRDCRKFYTNAC